MIEILFKCSKCDYIYKAEVVDNNDNILQYLPEGWYIVDEGTVDEKLLCQDCFDWFEHEKNW